MFCVILNNMSLSYTTTPFHPELSYLGQVGTELNLANTNFTTLAQAFLNSDPTSLTVINAVNSLTVGGYTVSSTPAPNVLLPLNSNGQFPSSVFPSNIGGNAYSNPINLTSATADYMLQPGQVAYISFTSATSVSLCVATTNGSYYEMHIACSNTSGTNAPVYLNPNNTTYSNAFTYLEYWITTASSGTNNITYSSFRIGNGVVATTVFISNYTTLKTVRLIDINTGFGSTMVNIASSIWNDTTTSWTSLGTVMFPQASSGFILVRRKA